MGLRTRDYRDYKDNREYGRSYSTNGMLREIERLREQADDLRDALDERVAQSQKLQRMLGERDSDYSEIVRRVGSGLDEIQDQIDDLGREIKEKLGGMREEFYKSLVDQNKVLESTCMELDKRLKELQQELKGLNENDEAIKTSVLEIQEELKTKIDKKAIQELGRKNTILMGITIANTTGIVMCVMLLFYLLSTMGH